MFYTKKSKKVLMLLTTAVIASSVGGVYAAEKEVKVEYKKQTSEFVLNGQTSKTREAVIFRVYPYQSNGEYDQVLSSDGIASGINGVFKTFISDTSGNVNSSVKLAIGTDEGELPYGRYMYDVINNGNKSGSFVILADDEYLSSYIASLNSDNVQTVTTAISSDGIKNVFDDGKDKDYSYLAQELINLRDGGKYNAQTFIDAYLIAEGLYHCNAKTIDVETFFGNYSSALGDEVCSKYKELSDSAKAAVGTLFSENIIKTNFKKEFDDNVFAASYYAEKDFDNMKKLFLEYAENGKNVDLTDYKKLNSVYQENVFTAMFNGKTQLKPAADIVSEFKKNVSSELTKQNGSSGSQSSRPSGGGGGGSASGGTIIRGENTPTNNTADLSSFNDIKNHWANDYIEAIAKKSWINGYDDKSFKPDNKITRAEFAVILSRALGLSSSGAGLFDDVASGVWYEGGINAAAENNIVEGDNGRFNPNSNITRQDVAVMLKRVLDMKNVSYEEKKAKYSDYDQIADYAKSAVDTLAQLEIMSGNDGKINPNANITRAETAAVLYRLTEIL